MPTWTSSTQHPIAPICPLCATATHYYGPPLDRIACTRCAVSWTNLASPGLCENPHATAPPLGAQR